MMYRNINESSADYLIELLQDKTIITVNIFRATLKESGEFKNVLDNIIKQGFKNIIIDFQKVDFVDSTFLAALIVNLKKINEINGRLILINLKHPVSMMIEFTGLNKIFGIFQSREEALYNI